MFAGKVCKQRNAERLDKHDLRRAIFLVRPVSGEVFAKARTDQWYELGRREQTMPEPRALPKKARHIAGKIVVVCGYEGRSRTSGYIQRGRSLVLCAHKGLIEEAGLDTGWLVFRQSPQDKVILRVPMESRFPAYLVFARPSVPLLK